MALQGSYGRGGVLTDEVPLCMGTSLMRKRLSLVPSCRTLGLFVGTCTGPTEVAFSTTEAEFYHERGTRGTLKALR